jgi:hypothetical protein
MKMLKLALCPHLQSVVSITRKLNIVENAYPERAVPATRAKSHSIGANTQAANSVFVTGQYTDSFSLQGIPNVARPIIVPTKQNASRDRKCN